MEASIGVLIVGSLYWDEDPSRRTWRQDRLDLGNLSYVSAPIRYGRESQKRGSTYTMVFSRGLCGGAHQLGVAIAAPCRRSVSSVKDLLEEAESLWAAERNSDTPNGTISAEWGCVGLVTNPRRNIPAPFLDGWAQRVARESGYGQLRHANAEDPLLSVTGILQIPWPQQADGQPLTLDILLATATNPTIKDGRYPAPKKIADAWITPTGRQYVDYFWNNRSNRITTFQDGEIERHLKGATNR